MTSNRMTPGAGVLILFAVLAGGVVSGCSEGNAWAGTVADSAGIRIVSNPASSQWPEGTQPVFEEQLRIGSAGGDPNYQFGQIAAMAVGPDGTVYVLDQQASAIRVFDAAGQFVREIGRKGSGPGELSQAAGGLLLGPGGTLLVPDPLAQRITLFTTDGEPAGEYMMSFTDGIPLRFDQLPDLRIVQQVRVMALPGQAQTGIEPVDRLLVRAADGTLSDTLLVFPSGGTFDFAGGAAPRIRIFEPEPMWAIGLDGKLFYAVNTGYNIEVRSADGTLERMIRKPFERQPVTDADQQAFRDVITELFEQQGLPPEALAAMSQMIQFADHYPAFANLMRGPGNTLLVQHVRSAAEAAAGGLEDPRDMGSPTWDVFDAEGRLMGEVELPAKFTPLHIRSDEMWGVWRDDLDVQYVVKLKVTGLQAS